MPINPPPSDMSLRAKALEIAISQIGQDEKPHGSNWGHPVQDYLASVGIVFPASWCCAFIFWCFREAARQLGVPNPMAPTGGVLNQWSKRRVQYGVIGDPQPGDIFIQDHGGGLGHCGIVEINISIKTIQTIEGNTNNDGSRNGFEVERKQRLIHDPKIIGYLRFT